MDGHHGVAVELGHLRMAEALDEGGCKRRGAAAAAAAAVGLSVEAGAVAPVVVVSLSAAAAARCPGEVREGQWEQDDASESRRHGVPVGALRRALLRVDHRVPRYVDLILERKVLGPVLGERPVRPERDYVPRAVDGRPARNDHRVVLRHVLLVQEGRQLPFVRRRVQLQGLARQVVAVHVRGVRPVVRKDARFEGRRAR
mmetsp:Transcript_1411/g.3983  ORF Transcript_1411/g.3983 Transcript_1411/m.3983 type:complete len:200 (-) Transcript_1411:123-722(-)